MAWHHIEQGTGRTLILLHGIGMSHAAWKPVLPLLAGERRVMAFDTPGFGGTPPLPAGTAPTIPHLVDALVETLDELGVALPVDIAGHSHGGRMTLEAARRGLARTAVCLAPAGLWKEHESPRIKRLFGLIRFGARTFPALTRGMLKFPALRSLLMAPLTPGGSRTPAAEAIESTAMFATAPAFEATFKNNSKFVGGMAIQVPLTVAFGTHDCVLAKDSQSREELPPHTRWLRLEGWGHVPMWYDPEGVSRLILEGTA